MFSIFCSSLLAFFICTALFSSSTLCHPSNSNVRDLIILTDMEPDDRIALAIVATRPELSERLLFVGTTLLNTELKAELARKQLKDSGLDVPVYAGSGGPPSSYPYNVETAKAALKFWHEEGSGILPEEELKKFRGETNPKEANADDTFLDYEAIAGRTSLIEDFWSIEIKGLPESKAPKKEDSYHDDERTVTRLLDMLNIGTPPKYVYRISKPPGILLTAPRTLKVVFSINMATSLLVREWSKKCGQIRTEIGIPNLEINAVMNSDGFVEAKERFFEAQKNFEPSLDIHQKRDEQSQSARNEVLSSRLAETYWLRIMEFLKLEESRRSIRITGLPDYIVTGSSNHKGKEQRPSIQPSERYKADFKAVIDILFAIGVEVSPLAINRIGADVDARGRRAIKVIFRDTKAVEYVLLSWPKLKFMIRNKNRPLWSKLNIEDYVDDFHHNSPGYKIENKEQLLETLEYLHDTPVQVHSKNDGKYEESKQQNAAVSSANMATDVGNNNELQIALIRAFRKAKRENNSLEIVLMTAPIDLVKVLHATPALAKAIGKVHLMGGWVVELTTTPYGQQSQNQQQQPSQSPPPTIWGNYNLNMAPESSRRLFEMASEKGLFPMRLYTYRHVWEMFEGSVNRNKFPTVIEAITKSTSPVLHDFRIAAKSWDEHAMRVMPYLTRFISQYTGEQFSPADIILVIGLLKPSKTIKKDFITKICPVTVNVKHEQLEMVNDVLEVQIEYDRQQSRIELITGLEKNVFQQQLERSLGNCTKCGKIGHLKLECLAIEHVNDPEKRLIPSEGEEKIMKSDEIVSEEGINYKQKIDHYLHGDSSVTGNTRSFRDNHGGRKKSRYGHKHKEPASRERSQKHDVYSQEHPKHVNRHNTGHNGQGGGHARGEERGFSFGYVRGRGGLRNELSSSRERNLNNGNHRLPYQGIVLGFGGDGKKNRTDAGFKYKKDQFPALDAVIVHPHHHHQGDSSDESALHVGQGGVDESRRIDGSDIQNNDGSDYEKLEHGYAIMNSAKLNEKQMYTQKEEVETNDVIYADEKKEEKESDDQQDEEQLEKQGDKNYSEIQQNAERIEENNVVKDDENAVVSEDGNEELKIVEQTSHHKTDEEKKYEHIQQQNAATEAATHDEFITNDEPGEVASQKLVQLKKHQHVSKDENIEHFDKAVVDNHSNSVDGAGLRDWLLSGEIGSVVRGFGRGHMVHRSRADIGGEFSPRTSRAGLPGAVGGGSKQNQAIANFSYEEGQFPTMIAARKKI